MNLLLIIARWNYDADFKLARCIGGAKTEMAALASHLHSVLAPPRHRVKLELELRFLYKGEEI